jgi:hypothetical protein
MFPGQESDRRSLAERGTVPLEEVTAVLIKGAPSWTKITEGSFELCEINLRGANKVLNGVVGYRFSAVGASGKESMIFIMMDAIAAVQVDSKDPSEGKSVNNNK